MKRTILFIVLVTSAISGFAASRYGEPELPGWLTFMGFVMMVWGILEIILFFKVWGITNDVKALKKDHFYESAFNTNAGLATYLRRNLVLGNKEIVKRTLLKNFIDNVVHAYGNMPTGGYEKDQNGIDQWVSYEEKNLEQSIRPYVDHLQKQFDKIDEELPAYIQRMQTFSDYYSLFVKEDLTIEDDTNSKNS